MIDVCLIMNDFNRGGAERFVRDLAIQLQHHAEITPTLIVANTHGTMKSEFEESDLRTRSLDVGVSMKTIPAGIVNLRSELCSLDPDLVHSHISYSHLISRTACALLSIPHVATYHNVREKRTLPKRTAERAMRALSDRIICVSDGVRQSYDPGPSMEVIYNAIDVREFNRRVLRADTSAVEADVSPDETVFLNVARCVDVKRQQDLIRAVSRVESEAVKLFIVGDGPRRSALEETVLKEGVADRVTVTGYVESVEPYYAVADAFVSASSREGLPSTHIEAMASKLPIVTTRIPGVTELVEHGVNGFLCPVADIDSLAESMERICLTDTESLAANGFRMAELEFSIEKIARDHEKLYREIAERS